MVRFLIFFLFVSSTFNVKAQQREELTLGLFWNERPKTIIVSVRAGEYKLIADEKLEIVFKTNDMFHISVNGSKVHVKNLSTSFGAFSKVEIIEVNDTSSLNIKSSKPKLANRVYEDDFIITSNQGRLKILNHATLANYVAGVIQWEAGKGRTPEYYKVQAIITRTYALKNINKYEADGFNLCDRVDSQVYKGRTKNKAILKAVKETHDLVLVDKNMRLISALFYSNSGGHTQNSEDVWSQRIPYLRGKPDPYSIGQKHYTWTKTISKEKWLSTFKNTFKVDIKNSANQTIILNYCTEKAQVMFLPKEHISTVMVRSTFHLRSTNFCVNEDGSNIIINGKGFGHGVGLSQEGAMKMADEGFSFEEILEFYYTNVHLVHRSTMDYLEAEE